jgi:hypothetical protein
MASVMGLWSGMEASFLLSKKMLCIFFEEGDRAEFGPQSTFSTYTPPKK